MSSPTAEGRGGISSADVYGAIINRAPGPLDIPLMRHISLPYVADSLNVIPPTSSTTHHPMIIGVTQPFSSTTWFFSKILSMLFLITIRVLRYEQNVVPEIALNPQPFFLGVH